MSEGTIFRRTVAQIAPPTLEGAVRFPHGRFLFKSRLPQGADYIVEATTDLKAWHHLSDGTANGEVLEYIDSDASRFRDRFYRLWAGGVPSVNVVGYASVSLPPGYSLIANPLDAPCNNVSELFQRWPDGTSLSKFDVRLARLAGTEVKGGQWTDPPGKLVPGEGALFFNPTSDYKSHSFVGEVTQGKWSTPIGAGVSLRSSLVPQPGSLEELGFPLAEGDIIHLFDREGQKYLSYSYANGKWAAEPPILGMGESFWVAKTSPGNWVQHMYVRS